MEAIEAMKTAEIKQATEGRKLKLSEKLALVIGSAPNTFHTQMIQTFLLFFYTDFMKINPAYVAVLFLIVRIISAIAAPFFGALIDKIKLPWGKYTPWFVILGVPFGITGWLTFTNPGFSPAGSLVYAVITYTFYSVLSAIIALPGGAIVPTVTKRVDERVALGQFGFLFTIAGALIVAVGAVPIYKSLGGGNDARGFSLFMAIAAVCTALIAIYQATKIKERYIVEKKEDKSPSYKELFAATFTNKAAVIAYIGIMGSTLSAGVRSAVQIHFFKYFFHNEGLMMVMGMVGLVPALLGVALSRMVIKRFGMKATILSSIIFNLVTCPILLFIPSNNTGLMTFIVVSVLSTAIGALGTPALGAMMPAAIDYTEWKKGLNINAFMTSFTGFIQAIATALSGALAAGALTIIGYEPGVEQSSSVLFGLKIVIFVLPVVLGSVGISILWFDLTEDKQEQIAKELAERRKKMEDSNEAQV